MQYITPKPNYGSGSEPKAGDTITLAISAGGGSMITVYDETMTQARGSYPHGTKAMLLRYGPSSCMIYVGGGVAYVSTWNVNY